MFDYLTKENRHLKDRISELKQEVKELRHKLEKYENIGMI